MGLHPASCTPANRDELRRYGLCEECVAYKCRWFAVLDDAPAVLPRLLTHRRPVGDLTTADPPPPTTVLQD